MESPVPTAGPRADLTPAAIAARLEEEALSLERQVANSRRGAQGLAAELRRIRRLRQLVGVQLGEPIAHVPRPLRLAQIQALLDLSPDPVTPEVVSDHLDVPVSTAGRLLRTALAERRERDAAALAVVTGNSVDLGRFADEVRGELDRLEPALAALAREVAQLRRVLAVLQRPRTTPPAVPPTRPARARPVARRRRVAQIVALLEAQPPGGERITARVVAERLGITTSYASELLANARQHQREHQPPAADVSDEQGS